MKFEPEPKTLDAAVDCFEKVPTHLPLAHVDVEEVREEEGTVSVSLHCPLHDQSNCTPLYAAPGGRGKYGSHLCENGLENSSARFGVTSGSSDALRSQLSTEVYNLRDKLKGLAPPLCREFDDVLERLEVEALRQELRLVTLLRDSVFVAPDCIAAFPAIQSSSDRDTQQNDAGQGMEDYLEMKWCKDQDDRVKCLMQQYMSESNTDKNDVAMDPWSRQSPALPGSGWYLPQANPPHETLVPSSDSLCQHTENLRQQDETLLSDNLASQAAISSPALKQESESRAPDFIEDAGQARENDTRQSAEVQVPQVADGYESDAFEKSEPSAPATPPADTIEVGLVRHDAFEPPAFANFNPVLREHGASEHPPSADTTEVGLLRHDASELPAFTTFNPVLREHGASEHPTFTPKTSHRIDGSPRPESLFTFGSLMSDLTLTSGEGNKDGLYGLTPRSMPPGEVDDADGLSWSCISDAELQDADDVDFRPVDLDMAQSTATKGSAMATVTSVAPKESGAIAASEGLVASEESGAIAESQDLVSLEESGAIAESQDLVASGVLDAVPASQDLVAPNELGATGVSKDLVTPADLSAATASQDSIVKTDGTEVSQDLAVKTAKAEAECCVAQNLSGQSKGATFDPQAHLATPLRTNEEQVAPQNLAVHDEHFTADDQAHLARSTIEAGLKEFRTEAGYIGTDCDQKSNVSLYSEDWSLDSTLE